MFGGGVDAELFEVDAAVAVVVEDALAAGPALGDVVGFAGEDPPGPNRAPHRAPIVSGAVTIILKRFGLA